MLTFCARSAYCLVVAFLFRSLLPSVHAEIKPLQPLDIFEFEYAGDPTISPNGRQIVYVRHFSDIMTDLRYTNLWLINADGTGHRALTTGHHHDGSPQWSPDGSRLLYISSREGSAQLYVRWMDTGEVAKITNLQEAPSAPVWSPDGRSIAFKALVPEPPLTFAKLPARPARAQWAEPLAIVDSYMYRYDGIGYLRRGYVHIFVVPAEGGTARQVSRGDFHHARPRVHASGLVWTPDGKYLLMSTNRHSNYEFDPANTEIYEFEVATGEVRALTDRQGPDSQPVVSPDGKQIAFAGFDDNYKSYQLRQLYVMNRDGSGVRRVSPDIDRSFMRPAWTPDGSGLLCLLADQGDTQIALVSLDGTMKVLTGNVGTAGLAFSYGASFAIAKTGTLTFPYSSVNIPGDIAVASLENPKPRIVTGVNDDLFPDRTLGSVEEIWYTSSLDQRRIHGWILKPPGFDPSRKYPLILQIHGGPFAYYGAKFSLNMQISAAHGYVVLYTNPRGSTSYGAEFANEIHYEYPGDDFYDLNSGVDFMLTRGYIDSDNLFVTGGSGGGILTCWMIGHTDRFTAAASLYPAINWYAFVLTIDDPLLLKYQFPGFPWDHLEHYESRNLLSVVKNVRTPTLLLTGEKDYRTPLWEAEQYYRALKLLKVETVLVRVPGEPHGAQNRPSHHMDKLLTVLGWFENHKKEK